MAAPSISSSSIPSSSPLSSFVLPRLCDDFHLHLRDSSLLSGSLFPLLRSGAVGRATIMPNLQPPVTDLKMAREYRDRILTVVKEVQDKLASESTSAPPSPVASFTPLMTLYLTDATTPQQNLGVADLKCLLPTFEAMSEVGMLLLIHGEVTDAKVDIFDRESSFLPQLEWLIHTLPSLRIVLEHVTTSAAVDFIKSHQTNNNRGEMRLAATITPQHLLMNRNALFEGGLNPHLYCLPVLKSERDRQALLRAVFDPVYHACFFAGSDSAPHVRESKERSWGCAAGCFSAFATVELYTEALVAAGEAASLSAEYIRARIEGFLSIHGAEFYGLERNKEFSQEHMMVLERKEWTVPETMPFGDGTIIPLRAGKTIEWRIKRKES